MSSLKEDYLRVPKLEASGTNWVIYKDRLRWATDARGYLGHLDGTNVEPSPPIPVAAPGPTPADPALAAAAVAANAAAVTAYDAALATHVDELSTWKKGEAVVKQLVASTITDSQFMKVRTKPTAAAIWAALTGEFEKKSRMVSVDLRRRLQDTRCGERDDLRTHFSKLRTMREDLSAMGHPPSDDDFYAIILGSLPSSYDPYISAVTATSSVLGTSLSAEDLMITLTEEYERRSLRSKGARKDESKDAAFYSTDGKARSKRTVECYNCHKKGHMKADCWSPGGGKEGQGPKGKGKAGEAGGAAAADSKDAAWMAMAEDNIMDFLEGGYQSTPSNTSILDDSTFLDSDSDDSWFATDSDTESLPDLVEVLDSDDEDDGMSEASDDWMDDDNTAFTDTFDSAFLTGPPQGPGGVETELYDSGASR
ncbi:hypothetical protein EUX98_g9511 [Antrodiella citrinella]|uniref:CCHC-type domain-containing protein n=1 Tax=Antrodiella citrinella TaxID=2447956 RepID=A0A4S4LRX5_9APHY|nr:hypothetical protein EUX98_g9511 [Antrodiella citrinella]